MSKQRTIWEKMSTLWPPALRRGSSLSSSTSFPADRIRACKWKSGARGSYTSRNSATIFSSAPEHNNKNILVLNKYDTCWQNLQCCRCILETSHVNNICQISNDYMNYMAQFRSVSLSVPKVQRAKKKLRPNVVYQCQRMNSDK